MMWNKADRHSLLYLVEKLEVGIVYLDAEFRIQGLNHSARRILSVGEREVLNQPLHVLHERDSMPKVQFLLDQAAGFARGGGASSASMIINIPDKTLLLKASAMAHGTCAEPGFALVFYDLAQMAGAPPRAESAERALTRVPTQAQGRVEFVDIERVQYVESEAHCTHLGTVEGRFACGLSIGKLEARLPAGQFIRIHRCFLVNLKAIAGLRRDGSRTQVVLQGGDDRALPVSRRELRRLREALGLLSSR